jgi:predicted permease
MTIWNDLRYAFRLFVKDRWFTAAAATALALGIGANSTVFTLVNAVLIRGLPFDEPDRIISLGTTDARNRDLDVSYLDYRDWRDANRSFTGLAAYSGATMNVSDAGRAPERYQGVYITANGFRVIGERAALGRDFVPEDDLPGAPAVLLLGNGVWKSRYGSDPAVVGRSVRVNDVPSVVVGVMPEGFRFPNNADMWQPLSQMPGLADQKRDTRPLSVFGRLAPNVTLAQASSDISTIAARLSREYPEANKDIQPTLMTWNDRVNGGPIRLMFLSLMGAVAFVLLIACSNVANLLLSRSAHRAREIAVRVSLGATRWQIVRQLIFESLLLAAVGGVVGLGLSIIGVRIFDAAVSDPSLGKPYWIKFTMDGRVIGFLAAVCLGTGLLFGLAPALHVSKTDVNEVLKEGGRSATGGLRARRWTNVLLVVELALTLVLLAGAGFMARSFLSLYHLDLGIDPAHLTTMRLALPDRKYPTPEARVAFVDQLEDRLTAVPSIEAGSVANVLPLSGGGRRLLTIDGRPVDPASMPPSVTTLVTGPGYFDALDVNVRGRAFTRTDGAAGREAVVVNERLAALHFPNEDPIGRRIRLTVERAGDTAPAWMTIVGVSPTVRQEGLQDPEPDPVAYLPYRANPVPLVFLIVRGPRDASEVASVLREEVRALDPDLPLFSIRGMDEVLAVQRWPYRVFGTMFAVFAAIALVLSAVGLYGVTAYSVAQRRQEIGVRMALGARPGQVRWLVVRQGIVKLAIGLSLGLAGALGVGRLLGSLLVQTGSHDLLTLGTIALVLAVVSIAACLGPARRATRLDPVAALRSD